MGGICDFVSAVGNASSGNAPPPLKYSAEGMIYLDHNSTTPVAPAVLEEMLPAFAVSYGNPSNLSHAAGRAAANLVSRSRERLATAFDTSPARVVFTSGSTESLNLVIKGMRLSPTRTRILVGSTEHKAVLEAAVTRDEARVELLPVRADGTLDPDAVQDALDDDVALIALMAVNNETGVIHSLNEIFETAKGNGVLTLCDATQAIGRIDLGSFSVADFVAISGHKIYGPKGVGCLIGSREGLNRLNPIASGGGQERGLRSGTLNVPGIVGVGAAVELVESEREGEVIRQTALRDLLHEQLVLRLDGVHLNGHKEKRVCNTLNLRFEGADGEAVIANLQHVAASVGSACQSSVPTPSHVLLAMGLSTLEAEQSVRFSLGRCITSDDVEVAVDDIVLAVTRVRELVDA